MLDEKEVFGVLTIWHFLIMQHSVQIQDAVNCQLGWIALQISNRCREHLKLRKSLKVVDEAGPLSCLVCQAESLVHDSPDEMKHKRIFTTKQDLCGIGSQNDLHCWHCRFAVADKVVKCALVSAQLVDSRVQVLAPILPLQKG